MTRLLGDKKIEDDTLESMRSSPANYPGTRWAVYQNHAMGSAYIGRIVSLAIGPENTYKEAPRCLPDGPCGVGWRYIHIGWANLETGEIEEEHHDKGKEEEHHDKGKVVDDDRRRAAD